MNSLPAPASVQTYSPRVTTAGAPSGPVHTFRVVLPAWHG